MARSKLYFSYVTLKNIVTKYLNNSSRISMKRMHEGWQGQNSHDVMEYIRLFYPQHCTVKYLNWVKYQRIVMES